MQLNKLTVVVLAAALAIPALAAKPEKVEDAYYVAFKNGVGNSERALLKSSGAAVRDEFPELRVVEVSQRNPNAIAALERERAPREQTARSGLRAAEIQAITHRQRERVLRA